MHSLILVSLLISSAADSTQGGSKVEFQKLPDPNKVVARKEQPPTQIADLTSIRRVYVDKFGGGGSSDLLREMVIASLQNSRIFVLTENEDKADAVLKGSADSDTFKDLHISSESTNLHNGGSRSTSESISGHYSTRESDSVSNSSGTSESSSSHIEERKHEASAAVRLVLKNGDIVWSTTQESLGAKFRGASADVADKITRQLVADWRKAKQARADGE